MEKFKKIMSNVNTVLESLIMLGATIFALICGIKGESLMAGIWLLIAGQSLNAGSLREISNKISSIDVTEESTKK